MSPLVGTCQATMAMKRIWTCRIFVEGSPFGMRTIHQSWDKCRPSRTGSSSFQSDMQICVDSEWHNGVAVPLQHGTIVTWEVTLVRHCTAYSTVMDDNNCTYGTYFGVSEKVANHLGQVEERRNAAKCPNISPRPTTLERKQKRTKLCVKPESADV